MFNNGSCEIYNNKAIYFTCQNYLHLFSPTVANPTRANSPLRKLQLLVNSPLVVFFTS